MRFVYHHRTAGRGGEGVHISSVVRALRAAGSPVDIVSPPGVDPLSPAEVPLDKGGRGRTLMTRVWRWVSCSCPQIVFELLELGYNAYACLRLLRSLTRGGDSVLYERYAFFLFAGVGTARLLRRPVILEVNEVAGVQRARAQKLVWLATWLERRVFSRADEIITVSSFLQREVIRRGGRDGHVHVVPNAVDPERFEHAADRTMRTSLGLGGAVVVGFVGWFDKWDRLDRLIDLVRDLQPKYPALRLLLVGDGPVAGELRKRVDGERLDTLIKLTGPVSRSDVPAYIDAMDICVLPDSNPFGSPIVLFECMAMGKPVIAPDLLPIRDVITDGRTGVIVDRDAPLALRDAVEALLLEPERARAIGRAARGQVFERHTWTAVGRFVTTLATRCAGTRAAHQPAGAKA